MSPNEKLPNTDRVARILTALHHPEVEIPEHVDMFNAEHNDLPLDGDFVGAVTRQLDFFSDVPPEERQARVAEGSDRILVEYDDEDDYNSIFDTVPRKGGRAHTKPLSGSPEFRLIFRWFIELAKELPPGQENEFKTHPPGDPESVAPIFLSLLRDHLPHRLDLNSWVAQTTLARLQDSVQLRGGRFAGGKLVYWKPWMGTSPVREEVMKNRGPPPGFNDAVNFAPFLGAGGEGRVVWRSNQFGVPQPRNHQERRDDDEVAEAIELLQKGIVFLGTAIASHLIHWLVDEVVRPLIQRQRMRAFRFDHLVDAVKEILGDEWFDLPFDDSNQLRGWEHEPALELSARELAEVVRLEPSRFVFFD